GLPIAAPGPVAVVAAAVVVLRDVAAVAVAVGIGAVALDRPVLRGVDDRPRRRCRATVRLPDLLRLGRALAARVGPLRAALAGRELPYGCAGPHRRGGRLRDAAACAPRASGSGHGPPRARPKPQTPRRSPPTRHSSRIFLPTSRYLLSHAAEWETARSLIAD